ncbi:MAG: ribbon-helix-helix protein, CopG family [Mesorhizobium sp.]|nr:ribbon-helix-helix protein, CopG family [Mesorhizobium sp.]MBL8577710.1 ribbon-helix-helix protein, CopG family [Mesorhizobium sp.]
MRFTKPMNELIKVRVSSDEKRQLIEIARRRGLTLSDFLRQTATEAARRIAA